MRRVYRREQEVQAWTTGPYWLPAVRHYCSDNVNSRTKSPQPSHSRSRAPRRSLATTTTAAAASATPTTARVHHALALPQASLRAQRGRLACAVGSVVTPVDSTGGGSPPPAPTV